MISTISVTLILGIIATLLGAFLLKLNENFLPKIPRTRKARKLIRELKKKYLVHFQAQKAGRIKALSRPQYYFRDHDPTFKFESQLTFRFFAEQDFELEEFKGFLIPPLNREGRTDGDGEEHLRSDITQEWREYFQNIGRKAERTLDKTGLSCGQRIVFFDRFLLDFFISERASLLKYGRIGNDERDRLTVKAGYVPESSQLVRYAIRSAYTTAMIHELNRGYSKSNHNANHPPIMTYYYDKGHVKSTMYYDFGMYGIAGHTFVYMPIYRRGLDKRLVGERFFIDNTSHQRARINDFRVSFNELWEECEQQKHAEMRHRDRALTKLSDHTKLSDIDAYCFSHEFFEDTYINNVIEIFKEEFHWDLMTDKALPS